MCHLHDIYYLYYSEWLLIPYLRNILYITQIVVIRLQWSNRIIVCNSNNRWQKKLIALIPAKALLYCRSEKIGRSLLYFKQKKIFDAYPVDFTIFSTTALYDLMWTLILCNSITKNSKLALKGFIWDEFTES